MQIIWLSKNSQGEVFAHDIEPSVSRSRDSFWFYTKWRRSMQIKDPPDWIKCGDVFASMADPNSVREYFWYERYWNFVTNHNKPKWTTWMDYYKS